MSRARLRDGGFILLEIIVAIVVLGIALAALAPQVVSSLRATGKAKLVSEAKGVLQGQLDAMRALPFRVAPSAGDHLDLLDTYFRNLAAPTTTPACGSTGSPAVPLVSWAGYVAPAGTARCGYEPALGGAFYRYVMGPGAGSVPRGFAIILDTQFVSAGIPATVLNPAATFNTQLTGFDRAPVQQVGVMATVFYQAFGRWHPDTTYTQIAAQTPTSPRIRLAANATALEVGSNAPGGGEALSLTGGQLALSGTLFNASETKVGLTSIAAASSVSGRQSGASLDVSAPYTNVVTVNAPVGALTGACSGQPCWAASAIPPFVVAADNGLPRAGVQGLPGVLGPVQTLLSDNVTRDGFQFSTGFTTLPGLSPTLVSMDATPPVGDVLTNLTSGLYSCAFSPIGPVSHLTGSGYLNTTDELDATNPLSVEACGGGHTDVIRVLATDVAPDGLVRITARSSAKCTVTGAAHTPSAVDSYRAEVEYWSWTRTIPAVPAVPADLLHGVLGHALIPAVPGHGTYVSAGIITPTTVSDPLASVSLATPVSDVATLGDYVASWAGLTVGGIQQSVAGHIASLTVPALVTLQTTPVRGAGDPASAVSVAIGSSSCYAEDNR